MDSVLSNLSLQQIQIFLTVAETCNFSKAGEILHLTQPAISKCISTLERELGGSLFVRTTREVRITPIGQAMYNSWKTALWIIEEGYRDMLKALHSETRTLHLGIPNTANHDLYFWPRQEAFSEKHPDIIWNIESDSYEALFEKLAEGNYDMVFLPDFLHDTLQEAGLSFVSVARAQIQIIVPDVSPLFTKDILVLEDLLDQRFVCISDPHFKQHFHKLFIGYERAPVIGKLCKHALEVENIYHPSEGFLVQTDAFYRFRITGRIRRIPLNNQFANMYCAWHPAMKKQIAHELIHYLSIEDAQKNNIYVSEK